jgi:hypothetical protein
VADAAGADVSVGLSAAAREGRANVTTKGTSAILVTGRPCFLLGDVVATVVLLLVRGITGLGRVV